MARIFVFTADQSAEQRLETALSEPVAIRTVLSTFPPDTRPRLQEIERVAGGFYAWGIKPGARNQRTWARMRAGDPVLWVSNGTYRYAAWVIHRFQNAEFAESVWGRDAEGKAMEYLCFVSRPYRLSAPVAEHTEYLAKGYVGFTAISQAKIKRIEAKFGSFERFIEARLLPSTATAEASRSPEENGADGTDPPRGGADPEPPHTPIETAPDPQPLRSGMSPAREPVAEEAKRIPLPPPDPAMRAARPPASRSATWLDRAAGGAAAARSMVLNALVLALLALLLVSSAGELRGSALVIEPIEVPAELLENGYTPLAVARRLGDEIQVLRTERVPTAVGASPPAWSDTRHRVAEHGPSLEGLTRALRELLGRPAVRISGGILSDGRELRLRLRFGAGEAMFEPTVSAEEGPDQLIRLGAREIVKFSDPLRLAGILAERDPDAAIDAIEYGLARGAGDAEVYAYAIWGRALEHWGASEQALEKYEHALRLEPGLGAVLLRIGRIRSREGDLDAAIARFRRALDLDPRDAEALRGWAEALSAREAFSEALEKYEQAAELDPENVGVLVGWANSLAAVGHYDTAIERYRRASELDPGDARIFNNWGVSARALADHAGAAERFRRATELDPGYAIAFNNLGVALRALDDPEGAIASYRRATELDPGYAAAHNNWGLALMAREDFAQAAERFADANRAAPGVAAVHYNWGQALQALGDDQGALVRYRRAVELDPENFAFVTQRIAGIQAPSS